MTLDEINAALADLDARGHARQQDAVDPLMRGLHPAPIEWLTDDERRQHHELTLALAVHREPLDTIRERVRAKRAARLAAQ